MSQTLAVISHDSIQYLARLLASAVILFPTAAVAAPDLEGNIGIVAGPFGGFRGGLEGELSWRGLPLHVGGVVWQPLYGSGWAETAWAGLGMTTWHNDRLMLIAGGTHYVQSGFSCVDACSPTSENGLLLGVSYLLREERLWLQITPQYLFPLGGGSAYPSFALSGLPWVELGIPVTPHCDISLRLGETLLKVAYRL